MGKPLSERAAALCRTDRCTITDLRAILPELREAQKHELAKAAAREVESVDLALAEPDRDVAAAEAARANRLARAYADAIETIETKLAAKLESERRQQQQAEQDAALAERDEIAERFRAAVPDLVAKLLELFAKVDANDRRMRDAGLREANAEAVARGLPPSFRVGDCEVRRYTRMIVPAWDTAARAWPPQEHTPLPSDYDRRLRESRRKAKADAAEREAATWGWYRLSHRLGRSIRFDARMMLSDGKPAEATKARGLWKEPWAGMIAHREAERLRELGVKVEPIDRATAEAETAAAEAKANEGVYFPDARRQFP